MIRSTHIVDELGKQIKIFSREPIHVGMSLSYAIF